jgi:hypothetical protein|tara:strand:- start:3763 stop:3990 length:228 start_codon:yes stop_codon:yes gene_type:complete
MALTVKDSSGNNATVTALVFGDPILANSHIFNVSGLLQPSGLLFADPILASSEIFDFPARGAGGGGGTTDPEAWE